MRGINRNFGRTVRNIVQRFAEPRPPDSYLMKEVGIPGGRVEAGLSLSSYNPDLVGPAWFAKVDEMLASSSQAAVIELVVTLPIVSAEWRVEGGSEELRTLIETSLFGSQGMSTTWREVLYNACQGALYGTAVFEIIWKELDGALVVRRLVDRDPASVDRYEFDRDGGLSGIVQVGTDPATGDEVERPVKIDKLLLFPYRLRRREYHGRSILRPAYRHHESIRMLCGFADIGLDHSLVGVPVGQAPPKATPADIETFRSLLASIRRHEASGLVLPAGWDLVDGVKLGGGDAVGFLDYIQWHEGAMLRAALASFMQLGSTKTGTTELSGDLLDFSLMSWGALADMIAGVVNRHLVRRICDYNAGGELSEEDYPELVVQPIAEVFGQRRQAGEFLGAVASGEAQLPAEPAERAKAMSEGLGLLAALAGEAPATIAARFEEAGREVAAVVNP